MPRLEVDTRTEDGVAVVTPRGELDVAGTPALEDALAEAAETPAVAGVVVDLSKLDFMDSSGLRAVVLADRRLREQGLRFALVRGGEPVHRVFELTRMTERLPWVDAPGDLLTDAEERA
jgi:anti-sigma B factor antagonist